MQTKIIALGMCILWCIGLAASVASYGSVQPSYTVGLPHVVFAATALTANLMILGGK